MSKSCKLGEINHFVGRVSVSIWIRLRLNHAECIVRNSPIISVTGFSAKNEMFFIQVNPRTVPTARTTYGMLYKF